MKKKLIYFTAQKIPSIKAHSIQITKMCENFSQLYVTLLICGKSEQNSINIKNKKFKFKKYDFFKNKFLLFFQKFFVSLRNLSKYNTSYFTRDVHFAFILSLLTNQKIFLELHYPYIQKTMLSYHLLKTIFKKKNIKLIFISGSLLKIYKKNFANINNQYVIAHDASDNFQSFSPKNKVLNVGYSGHLYKGRGISLIIKLAKNLKDYNFNVAGGDKERVQYYRKKTLNIKNLNFFGHIEHNQIKKFFSRNHILIAPYESKVTLGNKIETSNFMSPLKIFEYMSSKKPLVSSNHKVLQEVLINNKNSLLCRPNNLNEWILALKKLKSSKLRMRLARQSYIDYKMNFTWEKRILKILDNF